ncbi:SacI homology domain-containing protein [Gongronella butleri]|nr:SacI homology domain-containing protein [Gongronella butleri]
MKLYTTATSFVVEHDAADLKKLVLDRASGSLSLADAVPSVGEQLSSSVIFGILGCIKLQAGDYLIVITGRESIGAIQGHHVYQATQFEIIPLATDMADLADDMQKDERIFVDLLQQHLKSGVIYYSPGFDLTQSLQRKMELDLSLPLWKRADERFFWNKFLAAKFIEAAENDSQFDAYITPFLQGFVKVDVCRINDRPFVMALITRRSRHRPGTRYFSRGIDAHGHVSNYVETEQIILYDGPSAKLPLVGQKQMSYVQTRGSIPVYWAQLINLKYTPRLWVGDSKKSAAAARLHFDEQISVYGDQLLVNLVNTKGYELPMGQAYANVVKQLNDPRLRYTHFDFHKECSKMRWHRIQLLVDELNGDLETQGYFEYDIKDGVIKKQKSVVRTNCMDCLDRTNVVQSTLAKHVLTNQLRQLAILGNTDVLDAHEDFMTIFRNVWADNADRVSVMYSGTGALKTDFTRTGKRTKGGALQDLNNSITRYVKNNFLDGQRQDGYDLFLGNYRVGKEPSNPFVAAKPLRVRAVPPIVLFALVMLLLHLLHPSLFGSHTAFTYLAVLVFWFSVLISALKFALRNSDYFVALPHLLSPPQTVEPIHEKPL